MGLNRDPEAPRRWLDWLGAIAPLVLVLGLIWTQSGKEASAAERDQDMLRRIALIEADQRDTLKQKEELNRTLTDLKVQLTAVRTKLDILVPDRRESRP